MAAVESLPCGFKHLPVTISPDNYLQEFYEFVLPHIRPDWQPDNVDCHIFESGITNTLIAFYIREVGLHNSGDDVILLRIEGEGTEKIINRTDEIVAILSLHQEGFSPPIYAKLQNGLCYGFLQGRHLKVQETSNNHAMMRKVAGLMSRLHSVSIPDHFKGREPFVWLKLNDLLKSVPRCFSNENMQKTFVDSIGSIENLFGEIDHVKQLLLDDHDVLASPVVLCHNDIHSANLIYNEDTDHLSLVDYEYAAPNYLAYDIANHFCEFSGIEGANYDMYPDETTQKIWIKMYLEEAQKLSGENQAEISGEAIDNLYQQINKIVLGCHLLWIVWALFQAIHSTVSYDFLGYAVLRYKEFLKRKAIYFKAMLF